MGLFGGHQIKRQGPSAVRNNRDFNAKYPGIVSLMKVNPRAAMPVSV